MTSSLPLKRRTFLAATGILGAHMIPLPAAMAAPTTEDGIDWHNVEDWGVEGRGFTDVDRYFDRLPKEAYGQVRDAVWNLSRHSAGMSVRFQTDATEIHVDYELFSSMLQMFHMPATGVSGVDLYAKTDDGRWNWLAVSRPDSQHIKQRLVDGVSPGMREYVMYLPLYNGVNWLKVGLPAGATFKPVAPRTTKPIVFYGTSIMHGACASRPGMAITAILERRLNRPVINLGFSGNGRLEGEVGQYLGQIDAACFAIDCLPNVTPDMVTERTIPLVRQLRAAQPHAAIVLVEDRPFSNSVLIAQRQSFHRQNHQALRKAYDALIAEGVKQLHYLPGDDLIGRDGEGAVDGSHPNDLGMMRYAEAYEPVLRKALAT